MREASLNLRELGSKYWHNTLEHSAWPSTDSDVRHLALRRCRLAGAILALVPGLLGAPRYFRPAALICV